MNNWLKDGDLTFGGGVSSNLEPDDIQPPFVAWGKNVSFRRQRPQTRPALTERLRLPAGLFQGGSYFSARNGQMIFSIGGYIHRVTVTGNEFAVDSIPAKFQNSPVLPVAWMQETDGSIVIQDGQSAAIIYDGATARRADPVKNEVPIGRMMAYGNGRLWVVTSEHEVEAGDIKQSTAGSELLFTEDTYFTGGGAFYFPGNLTGLAFMPTGDTSTGYGSLFVYSSDSIDTVRAEVTSRVLWQQIPGFITDGIPNIGTVSHRSIVAINQDLYFRSADNTLRSIKSARAEVSSPGNAPISNEVRRLLDYESQDLLDRATGIYFDGRLLLTASPCFGSRGQVVFKNLLSLDVSTLSGMQTRRPPAYDGEWSGAHFAHLVKGRFNKEERAFVVSTDSDGYNRLWEIQKKDRIDVSFAATSPIKSVIETRKYEFQNKNQLKRLESCEVSISQVRGAGSMTVYFRSDGHAKWTEWDSFTWNAKMNGGDPVTGKPLNIHPQFRSAVATLTAPDLNSLITLYALNVGFAFQIRLVWTGDIQIDRVVGYASGLDKSMLANRPDLPTGPISLDATGNEIAYEIPLESPGPDDPNVNDPDGAQDYEYSDENGAVYADENGAHFISQ